MHAVQQRSIATATPPSTHPLGSLDQVPPAAWWGWSWEPAVPLSVTELVAARDIDARTAALTWLVLAGHGSVLVAAKQPHAGKTTLLTALLDLVPAGVTRVYLRGGAEAFEFLDRTPPGKTLLVANELSADLPVYLWGPNAVRTLRALRDGYALASTLHADSAADAIARLRDELGADPDDLGRVDLLLVIRQRRLVSTDRLRAAHAGPIAEGLVRHDLATDGWTHDRAAEASLVGDRHGWTTEIAERAIAHRADRIADLVDCGVFGIASVKAALSPLNDLDEGGDG
jgi:hypothetical protein